MMTSTRELEQQIETLVKDHLAACHKAVTAAVARAFTASNSAPPAPREGRAKAVSPAPQTRRRPEELAVLGERLYAAVCATPGETMTVLAGKLGTSARRLEVPVRRLKHADRVRSVGRRQHTRYFPMVMDETTARTPLVAVGRAS